MSVVPAPAEGGAGGRGTKDRSIVSKAKRGDALAIEAPVAVDVPADMEEAERGRD
jgi:hypothetical protein